MRAAVYKKFNAPLKIEQVPDPEPSDDGVVIEVKATGLCLSDWHGWRGHDPDIKLPHVPGHELAGIVSEVGKDVKHWRIGDRVTLPFVCGCGNCSQCRSGNQQVCNNQFQPGFTHWGSFAEYVAIRYADVNLVRLPDEIDFVAAASLGCRFVTAFRAIVDQGYVSSGQWVAVHGCGGVGLSAIMIAHALGARVAAVDILADKLDMAELMGADVLVHDRRTSDVAAEIRALTGGGAHVSVDALGDTVTCKNSIDCLRKRGKHIQIGLMTGEQSLHPIPMDKVIANELVIMGSHGMQAHRYDALLEMIRTGQLAPEKLIGKTIDLKTGANALTRMDRYESIGVTVIDSF